MTKGFRRKIYDTASDGSIGLVRRSVASWLGLVILVLNIAAGGAMPAGAADSGQPLFAQGLLGDRIVVCTAAGMVVMDRDGNVIDTGKEAGHTNLCVFCLPLVQGNVHSPAIAAVIVQDAAPARPAGEFVIARHAAIKPSGLNGASSPRAPPLS
jgi:hypothetical protein